MGHYSVIGVALLYRELANLAAQLFYGFSTVILVYRDDGLSAVWWWVKRQCVQRFLANKYQHLHAIMD